MGKKILVRTGVKEPREVEIEIEVGKEYVIQPLNPQKTKNRGRRCLILDFVPASDSYPPHTVAKVRYLDNNRVGKAELSDLILA